MNKLSLILSASSSYSRFYIFIILFLFSIFLQSAKFNTFSCYFTLFLDFFKILRFTNFLKFLDFQTFLTFARACLKSFKFFLYFFLSKFAFVFADPIELEHVFATFLAVLYVPAEMSESPKVDQTTLMDLSTTHTKLVPHPPEILMSAEMTTEDTTETSEMETILTAELIPESMPIGQLNLSGLQGQSSPSGQAGQSSPSGQAGLTDHLEVLSVVPSVVPLSGKVPDLDPN